MVKNLTIFDLFNYYLGRLDGWLLHAEAPSMQKQVDYFGRYDQYCGLNVQALYNLDLFFLYVMISELSRLVTLIDLLSMSIKLPSIILL